MESSLGRLFISLLAFIVSPVIVSAQKSIDVREFFSSANKTYIIRNEVDLGGESIIFPDDCKFNT